MYPLHAMWAIDQVRRETDPDRPDRVAARVRPLPAHAPAGSPRSSAPGRLRGRLVDWARRTSLGPVGEPCVRGTGSVWR